MEPEIINHLSLHCQGGKTTDSLSDIKASPFRDNFYLCADQNHILEDAKRKASLQNLSLSNINDVSNRVYRHRFSDGIIVPHSMIGLCNISTLQNLKLLLGAKKKFNLEQHLYLDESDKYGPLEYVLKNPSMRDHSIDWIYKNNLVDVMHLITASWQDIPYLDIPMKFNIIPPYPGLMGMDSAIPHRVEERIFLEVYEAFEAGNAVPQAFISLVSTCPRNTIINICSRTDMQKWLTEGLNNAGLRDYISNEDAGMYNHISKEDTPIIVGGHSLGRSSSFAQNSIIYWRKSLPTFSQVEQALGRINGTVQPYILTTTRIYDFAIAGFEWKKKALKDGALHLPTKERVEYFKNSEVPNPSKFSNTKVIRTISNARSKALAGQKANLVEQYEAIYIGDLWNEPWEGTAPGKAMKNLAEVQHPYLNLADLVAAKGYKTIMNEEEEGKFRSGDRIASVRFGKRRDKPGWGYVIIQLQDYVGEYSYYNHDMSISCNKELRVGNLSAPEKKIS